MFKKLLLVAALAAPSLVYAAPEIVIRVNAPAQVQHDYRDYHIRDYREIPRHDSRSNRHEQRQMIRWVNEEQERQRDRLIRGVRSGELTAREANRLRSEQAQIHALEQRYLADRYLTRREFAKLQEELRESSRNIFAQMNDRQDRDHRQFSRG